MTTPDSKDLKIGGVRRGGDPVLRRDDPVLFMSTYNS